MKALQTALALVTTAALLLGLAACGGSGTGAATEQPPAASAETGEAAAAEPVAGGSIDFWMQQYGNNPQNQQDFMNSTIERFTEQTGIAVNISYVDWGQAHTKYTLAASGGEAPDVADTFFAYSWVRIGGDQHGPMIIDDVVAEIGDSGWYDVATPECYIDGHWYALPWRGDTRAAAYNTQMFEEAGITAFPKTYDELIEVGKQLTTYNADGSVDRAGFLFNIGDARFDQTWFALLAGHGGRVMNEDYTAFTFNSAAGVESLKYMYDAVFTHNIVPEAVINPSYNSGDVFMAGKAAIVLGVTPELMVNTKTNAPQMVEHLASAVMPSKTGDGTSSIAFAAPVCIFSSTQNEAAAKEWLKFFCSKDVQLEACKVLGLVDSWLEVMEDPYFQEDAWYKPFTEQTLRANPGDMPIPEFSQVDAFPDGPLNTMCAKVMAGGDPQQALDECMVEIDKIMAAAA